MIELMDESKGNVLGVRFTGQLTEADYSEVLTPHVESLVKEFGTARALIFMDENFKGWDLAAAWANTKLDFQFRNRLDKVAIVGAPEWEECCVKLAGWLMNGELRTFQSTQVAEAWDWLRAGQHRSGNAVIFEGVN